MSDSYIDQNETQSYGPFAVSQMKELVVPLDPRFHKVLDHLGERLTEATSTVAAVLHKVGAVEVTTYKAAGEDGPRADPVAAGRDVLRRLARYAGSRPGGDALADKVLHGQTLSTVLRRRPAKLLGALAHALGVVQRSKAQLPEQKAWLDELTAAHEALDALVKSVSKSRIDRRGMTPEVQAARAEWLKVYGAAKLLVECVLRLHDKLGLMPEVFDDLAEVHRVAGVTDGPAEATLESSAPA